MQGITNYDLEVLILQAHDAPRLRTMYRLHPPDSAVQRMVNAMLPGTYVPPHKHADPDKPELLSILRGRVAVLAFDALGEVTQVLRLAEDGPLRIVDIEPRMYHTVIALEAAALLEVTQGPYCAETHKQLAPWSPTEDNPKATDYRLHLESIVHNWRG